MLKRRAAGLQERIVAFRAKPAEWQIIEREAGRLQISVGELAKRVLYLKLNLSNKILIAGSEAKAHGRNNLDKLRA